MIIKKIKNPVFLLLIISFAVSFFVNFYFGHQGFMPLDDLQNFNSGYRVFSGDYPFIDYYSVSGPLLDIWQAKIYKIFGLSWKSLVIHASLMNGIYSISIFIFLKKLNFNNLNSFIYSICAGLIMYPPSGTPTVEHHSLILSIIGFMSFVIGLKENKKTYLFFSIIIFGISFFIKQVPTVYFAILCIFLYFSQIFMKINLNNFLLLLISTILVSFSLISFFLIKGVNLQNFLDQYLILAMSLGESRFSNIGWAQFYDNISKLFFLLFLIIPSFFIFLKFNNKKSFILLFGLSIVISIYEIHSHNQPITFGILPLYLSIFIYFYNEDILDLKFVKYFFYIIILYAFYRILRFETFYLFALVFFSLIVFYKKKQKKNIHINFLVISYLLITTSLYFEKYVKIRAWDDLKKNDITKSFKGSAIDQSLKYLNWKTVYFDDPEEEKKLILETLNYLKNLDNDINYILISDYQIYNLILDKKDLSPVKYWNVGLTYPKKNHSLRENFEIFFKNKILDNNVSLIIFDGYSNFKIGELEQFDWLKNCTQKIKDLKYLQIFSINKVCLNNY